MEFVPFCKQMACTSHLGPNHLGNASQGAVQGRTCIKLRKHHILINPSRGVCIDTGTRRREAKKSLRNSGNVTI